MGVSLNYGFEYNVRFHCQFIMNLIVNFSFMKNMKSSECIHHPTFICHVESFDNALHWANGLPVI